MTEEYYREMRLTLPDRSSWTLPHIFRRAADLFEDRVYLEVPDDGRRLTFRETHQEATAIARGLKSWGGVVGDRLLIMAPNSAAYILSWFGSALAGMVEVPINTAYFGPFLEHQVRTTLPAAAVIDGELAGRFVEGDTTAYDSIRRYYVLGDGDTLSRAIDTLQDGGREAVAFDEIFDRTGADGLPELRRQDPAAIFFTSGTTGLSKGVTMSHSQLAFVSQQLISLMRLTEVDTHMSVGPLFHGNAQFLAAFPCLIAGAQFVLRKKFSASRWIDQIRECDATVTNFIGVMMDWTYKQPERKNDADNRLRCIYTVPTPTSILDDFARRFGVDVFLENYGMTEISMPVLSPYGVRRPVGAAGQLVGDYFEARIVDPDTDEELPVGEVGEFVVRAKEPWTMLTDYFNMPDRTAHAQRNLWFHSGDGVKRDADGWYYFVDRLKDAIRRRGENISSYEIEQAVLRNPRIVDCAVVAAPASAEAGEDEVALFVVVDPQAPLSTDEIREWCGLQLPAFAMPECVSLLEELPKTPSGKVRKVLLRELAVEQTRRR